ncbi:hypothetical protein Aperf_G00000120878 [Anoplocephala perfoliata]
MEQFLQGYDYLHKNIAFPIYDAISYKETKGLCKMAWQLIKRYLKGRGLIKEDDNEISILNAAKQAIKDAKHGDLCAFLRTFMGMTSRLINCYNQKKMKSVEDGGEKEEVTPGLFTPKRGLIAPANTFEKHKSDLFNQLFFLI